MPMHEPSILPKKFALGIYGVVVAITTLALLVHLTNVWSWTVDGWTLALLGVLLLIPVAERLRKFKVGKYLEAEFTERFEHDLDRLGQWVGELNEESPEPDTSIVEWARPDPDAFKKTIRTIVWVDDQPAGNRIEIADLSRRFEVITATSTSEGLKKIARPEETAVITDAVRVEEGTENLRAGVELLEMLREQHPGVPAYVYCGQRTVDDYAEPLEAAGARIVTASFPELTRVLRADARASLEAEVAAILDEHGEVKSQTEDVDFIVGLGGSRIGIEAKDYPRTRKRTAVDSAAQLLSQAIGKGQVDKGWVVTPRDGFVDAQRERTPPGVELISIADLPTLLATARDESTDSNQS